MKSMRSFAWAVSLVAVSAVPAFAQERNRPVEIGLGATGVVTWITSGGDLRASISIPVNDRVSMEFFGGPYGGSDRLGLPIKGFYGVQLKREIDRGSRAGLTPFLTFGAAGVVASYDTYDCPFGNCRRRSTLVLPPMIGLIGGGVQYTVNPRLAVRVEAQGVIALIVPAGVRVSVGVSIPVGHRFSASAPARSR